MKEIEEVIGRHEARNRELVDLITRKGGNLEIDRTVDLHFWAYDAARAESLAEALRECGLRNVIARVSAKDAAVWNVEGQIVRSVLQVVGRNFVARFAILASSHEADFDGWGTSL
ncbi:MAG: ribonuclease E inhibitor RraB [Acidobacteriota bacterium]